MVQLGLRLRLFPRDTQRVPYGYSGACNWCSSWSADIPPDRFRNYAIVAHIDHGKSTLADRILEYSGALKPHKMQSQYLDKLQVEKERGITVKAQTASIVHHHSKTKMKYLLNFVDTPGHVDFSYEVSRSLSACEGVLLLVDAAQGIQAQTVANCLLAMEENLEILPVLNKIDMPAANPEEVKGQIADVFGFPKAQALEVSAKTGKGIPDLLDAIVDRIDAPVTDHSKPFKALIFDAHHDPFRGVICLICIKDGVIHEGDKIVSCATGDILEVNELGIMSPEPEKLQKLKGGQIGYLVTGVKDSGNITIGDTIHSINHAVEALPGFKQARSMCFGGIFPASSDEYASLKKAIEKLTLNDSSVVVHKESSIALGPGFRCGFLGLLHMEVFLQRLDEEFGQSVIATKPFVPLRIVQDDGSEVEILSPSDWDNYSNRSFVLEPTVLATIICPSEYVGKVMKLCHEHRGNQMEHSSLGSQRVMFRYQIPLPELAGDFYDNLKSITSGYATFEYEESNWQEADLVKLDLRVNGDAVDSLSQIVPRSSAYQTGKGLVSRLKDILQRQSFEIAIQAVIGNKVIARETISAYRKNVLAKCYGGDVSRKRKLLEKQKEGKKRMKRIGRVDVPIEVFPTLLRRR